MLMDTKEEKEKDTFLPVGIKDLNIEKNIIPQDRFKFIYIIFMIHGIGTLIPWNVFINGKEYFEHKLNSTNSTDKNYKTYFTIYSGIAAQIPNFIFCAINCFYQGTGSISTTKRFALVMFTEITMLVFTISLVLVDTSEWPGIFFGLTILTIILINCSTGIYQSLIFGLAAMLPMKYTNGIITGSNLCGTVIALCNILTKVIASSATENVALRNKYSALLYFICASLILNVCSITYYFLQKSAFFQYYSAASKSHAEDKALCENENEEKTKLKLVENGDINCEVISVEASVLRRCFGICCLCPTSVGHAQCKIYWSDYWTAFKGCWIHCLSVFSIFFCTLAIFPGIQSEVKPISSSYFIPSGWFMDITCFLSFNFFALIGNIISSWIKKPGPQHLWIPAWIRTIVFLIFFSLSNFNLKTRILPVVMNDHVYQFGAIIFALTSGYLSSLGMMYAPNSVPKHLVGHAGRLATFSLVTGLVMGIYGSMLIIQIINGGLGGKPYYS